ncbi:hypothetical protein A9G08_10105 [Gilliamella sp. wkB195]|uniref:hypothetical protein n=1 Tax=unclassified Gilliamella TaxID=2685620 RepID=UPI00080DD623|nr:MULTISPECIES: hypothetical protein [Gilliamella]MCX8586089.1 hypothetical protein [Gilliamella sp. B3562]MCX8686229.1 hypothetical protein [Gilliamella sp. B2864]OCF97183.1 hypothetical protein A9G08_10105 [Gilliamella apicola]
MLKQSIYVCLLLLFLSGCNKQLSEEDKAKVAALNIELTQLNDDIKGATESYEQYSGGLIKVLIATRLEVLKTNKNLVEQRINSIESGAAVKVETLVTNPNPELAEHLLSEMQSIKQEIEIDKNEASKYSGGLIHSMKLLNIATKEQSLAALQQKYLTVKYGLSSLPKVDIEVPKPIEESDPNIPLEERL